MMLFASKVTKQCVGFSGLNRRAGPAVEDLKQ